MKSVTIADFKANMSAYVEKILKGEEYIVTHGRRKRKIFKAVPINEKPKKRKLGLLNGKLQVKFSKDFKLTTEEFLSE